MHRNMFKNIAKLPPALQVQHVEDHEKERYAPVSWEPYFDSNELITFNVFSTLCGEKDTLFLFLHGAGHSALSWALVAELMRQREQSTLCFDMRGHGRSTMGEAQEDTNFSINTLSYDTILLLCEIYPENLPNIILVGHSMGGTVASHIASGPYEYGDREKWQRVVDHIKAVVVVDVVEGTALESLPRMKSILSKRPTIFHSISSCIKWTCLSGLVKNESSAKVSVPPQVKKNGNDFVWRVDLIDSEPYWQGWFEGQSKKFLSCKGPKMLILAGTDRLDTELTIGQMQGKYQLVLLPSCGHCIQEDDPKTIVMHLLKFKSRYF